MNKEEALKIIRKAKIAHIEWRAYAQAVVSGVGSSNTKVPVEHTDCDFGKWYNGRGKVMFSHLDAFDSIRVPHEMLHDVYKKIFQIMHTEESGGLLGVFTSKTAREMEKMQLANQHMTQLIGISETLLKTLDLLEQEIAQLPEK